MIAHLIKDFCLGKLQHSNSMKLNFVKLLLSKFNYDDVLDIWDNNARMKVFSFRINKEKIVCFKYGFWIKELLPDVFEKYIKNKYLIEDGNYRDNFLI